jgi:two-component system phosphate regulon sensor histidine kinase PhoR
MTRKKKNKKIENQKSLAEEIFQSGEDRKITFQKLLKGSLIMTAAPAIILAVFVVNQYIDLHHGVVLFSCIYILSLLFIYPYLADLQELTKYVRKLSINSNPDKPTLSFLNNVEELSSSINYLNSSWLEKNQTLESFIEEDKILIDSIPNVLVMLDNNLKPIAINKHAVNIFGRKYTSYIDKLLIREEIKEKCLNILSGKDESEINIEIDEPKKLYFNINFEKFPSNSPSGIAILMVINDLTKEKKYQDMLEDFVANASHEMKTPLSSIKGFIETLLESDVDESNRIEFLRIAKEQGDRLEKLISDLLTLSVLQSGHKAKVEKIDVNILLNLCVKSMEKIAEDKDIKIIFENNSELNFVEANKDEISRVFDNLLSNAVKYGNSNSKVEVISENIVKDSDKYVKITFKDESEGIAEDDIPRLTERFYRVDKARSRKVGGSGIGLSIVKYIIENYDGTLEIKSEIGKGSEFSVYLPSIDR